MIPFFRRIRQELLASNKFSKYILYAIGEIILVVIGILIAVKINNYYKKQETNHYEREVVTLLLEDLAIDHSTNVSREKALTDGLKKVTWILEYCGDRSADTLRNISRDTLLANFFGGFSGHSQFLLSQQLHAFNPKSNEVNRSITSYNMKHKEILVDIEQHNTYSLGEFAAKTMLDLSEQDSISEDFLLKTCSEDNMVKYYSLAAWKHATLRDVQDLLVIQDTLKEQLREYLKNLE
ncbi:DUF6090 family protein [Salinimicrobium soli]|uniref:DUF6090 family protein n=1 Tax=Salinimicrobium soli TaxID=1254399 RepID=UPI003AB0E89A